MGITLHRTILSTLLALGVMVPAPPARAQSASGKSYEFDVAATKVWVDTNIDLHGRAKLRFTATGSITYPSDTSTEGRLQTLGTFGPDGLSRVVVMATTSI